MQNIPQIYDLAKTLYDKLINYTNAMFEFIGDEYKVSKDEVIVELDHFVQAILFRVALSDDKLLGIELSFIKSIVEKDDMFKNQNISYLENLTLEEKENGIKKCNEVLNEVPEFVKLSVLCDKKADSMLVVMKPTHCQKIFDYLKRIANYLKFIDGNVIEEEDKTAKLVLSSVVAYYKKKYVKYAPSRKEE